MAAYSYGINQRVLIIESDVPGIVEGLWTDRDEIRHALVRYVDGNKNIQHEWCRENEIKAQGGVAEPQGETGP